MKKTAFLAIFIFLGGCASTMTYIIKRDTETIPSAVKKAANNTVFIYAKNQTGKYEYSGSGFVVDRRGIIGTVRHILPSERTHRLYVLIKEKNKITIRRVLASLNLSTTDVAILYIRHHFTGTIPLRLTPPKTNEKLFYAGYPYVYWHEIPYRVQRVVTHGYFQKFYLSKGKRFDDVIGLAHIPMMLGASGSPILDCDGRAIGVLAFEIQKSNGGYTFTGFLAARHLQRLFDAYQQLALQRKVPPLQ